MTTTSTHETSIIVDADVPLVRIIREFDAPPAKVFRAHTDPELVARWTGPRRHEMQIDHWDCRTGGSHRYLLTCGGNEFVASGMEGGVRKGYERLDELLAR
jgi:uncharacterized protein YndB with AHSA1/START domain